MINDLILDVSQSDFLWEMARLNKTENCWGTFRQIVTFYRLELKYKHTNHWLNLAEGDALLPKERLKELKGHEHFILLLLSKSPLNKEGIYDGFMRLTAYWGIQRHGKLMEELDVHLDRLSKLGFVVKDSQQDYHLTEQGIEVANKLDMHLEQAGMRMGNLFSSAKTAAKVSIFANILLSVLKLVMGLLFNSMALIADGYDNLVDVLSAGIVFLGIKYRRELLATTFIIVAMFGTAAWIGYQSVIRIINSQPVDAGALVIAAAVISGAAGYGMSVYQHAVGKRTGSLSLISQSIDSRNHSFVAIAILVGIIFARFGIVIVDSIVGLAVAILILKSAIELANEALRIIAKGEKLDVSRFGREYEKFVENHRINYFKSWILYYIRDIHNEEEIILQYQRSFSQEDLPIISHFTFIKGFDFEKHFDSLIEELIHEGLIMTSSGHYYLTDEGNKALNRKLRQERYYPI
jgi:cation diffusion facilitator family transporter